MGTAEGRARSRSWFFTEKSVNGLLERQVLGQVYLGQNLLAVELRELRGRGLQPG